MTEPEISDADVDALVARFNGNARATIRALMHDLAIMVQRNNEVESRGFQRRRQSLSLGWGRQERALEVR